MSALIELDGVVVSTKAGAPVTLDRQALEPLLHGLRGSVCLPSDPEFDDVRTLFNAVHDKRPGMIVRCLGVSDIINCVNLAREHDLLVSIRGGGHHMSGFASCDGGMMIDLSRMKSVRIDLDKQTARAEPGCTLFDLDTECQAFGMAVPSGIVSHTGIAGLSLGGGLGWLMRSCGLTIDNILEFDVVTADGQLRKANAGQNPDLYWALRGGGGNFGVVTSFEYRLHPVSSVSAGWIFYPIERAHEVLGFYRDFIVGCSDRLVTDGGFWILPDGGKCCAVAVCYNGPPDAAEEVIRPLREFGVPPVQDGVSPMTFLEWQSMLDLSVSPGLRYHQKDCFIPTIENELIETIAASFSEAPDVDDLRVVAGFRYLAGAVSAVSPEETAFSFREPQFSFEITTSWPNREDDAAVIAWTELLYAAVAPFSRHGHYINGHMASREDFASKIYTPECLDRLASIKGKYDPGNLFRNNYNIKPSAAGTQVLRGACTQNTVTVDRQTVIAAIQKAEEAQAAALGRKDLDAAVAVFAEDTTLYVPGRPPASGREAIKAVNELVLEDPALKVAIDESSRKWWVSASGDLATTTYRYAWAHTDASSGKPVTEQVVSQTTWVRQTDGSWKNVSDLNSAYTAPVAPAE